MVLDHSVRLFTQSKFHLNNSFFQPPQFRLDTRLARLLSINNGTRQIIIHAIWQYIKTHKLQDSEEREFINCDVHLQSVRY